MVIKFKKTKMDAVIPFRATKGSAAYDLFTAEDVIVKRGKRMMIPTGIAIELPEGYVADVRPRSGYSLRGIQADNGMYMDCDVLLGTIDSDYRGEIGIIVKNNGDAFRICKNKRIAQLLIHKVEDVEFSEVYELSDTERGTGGFGHTNK